jgi:DNA-binding MarR family transcriptional regulator
VSGKLAAELRQTKPFASVEEEAVLNLARTHEFLQQRMAEFFKRFDLTRTQYNILRILRGAGKPGITCSQAAERMVTADPDITRLLDRLESRRLIARERSSEDRRVVISRITGEGLALLKSIDRPLAEFHRRQVGGLGREKLAQLVEMLESLREDPASLVVNDSRSNE